MVACFNCLAIVSTMLLYLKNKHVFLTSLNSFHFSYLELYKLYQVIPGGSDFLYLRNRLACLLIFARVSPTNRLTLILCSYQDLGKIFERGVIGEQGLQGPSGDPGTDGRKGLSGKVGDKGPQGDPGENAAGPVGDAGERGMSTTYSWILLYIVYFCCSGTRKYLAQLHKFSKDSVVFHGVLNKALISMLC